MRPIPRAVGKTRPPPPLLAVDPVALRESWTLDLLAFAQTGVLASKVDLHGARSALPPVVLDLPDTVWALDLWSAVAALQSRPRSFSQVAGRYAPLVVGAQGKRLIVQWWELQGEDEFPTKLAEAPTKLAAALGQYLNAQVSFHTITDASALLARLGKLPDKLVARNPLAWQRQAGQVQGD